MVNNESEKDMKEKIKQYYKDIDIKSKNIERY